MNVRPVALLHWTLAAVLALISAVVLLRPAAWSSTHRGVPGWVVAAVAAAELIAILLFVLPGALRVGAALLIAVLAIAAVVHLWAGETPPPSFLVYAASIWVIVAEGPPRRGD